MTKKEKKEIREAKKVIRRRLLDAYLFAGVLHTEASNTEFWDTLEDKVDAEYEKKQKEKDKVND